MLYNYIRCTYLKEIFKNKINIVYSWVKSRRITKTSGYSICAGKQFHNQHFLVNNSTKALNVCWKKTTICTVCLPQGYSTHPIQNLNKKKAMKEDINLERICCSQTNLWRQKRSKLVYLNWIRVRWCKESIYANLFSCVLKLIYFCNRSYV